ELSQKFEVQSGLKQGDTMSPILFNLALEKVIRDISVNHEMELKGKNVMLAYADDIVIIGDTENDVVEATEKVTERSVNKTALKVGPYSCEQVDEFKYLGVNVITKNNMHSGNQLRINIVNKAYFAMNKMLSSKLLSKETKEKLYTSFLRPIVMYTCETWSTTQGDEEKLLTSERKFTDLFDLKMENMRKKNKDLEMLFNKPNIRLFLKAKRLEWAGHVWRADENIIKNVLIRNVTKTRPRGRPRQRWLDRVKKYILNTDNSKRQDDAMDRNGWRNLVEACKRP
ncbi:Reverse transcriptase domain, partial [Cinara cedri]